MYTITKDNYENLISKNITIIDCYADWCGPCKMFKNIFESVENDYKDVCFCKLNVDDNRSIAKKLGIMSIPTIILFKDGMEVKRKIGFMDRDNLINFLEN